MKNHKNFNIMNSKVRKNNMVNNILSINSSFGKRLFSFLLGISILSPSSSALKSNDKNNMNFLSGTYKSDTANNKRKKAAAGTGIVAAVAGLGLLGLRALANSMIFPGIYMDKSCLPDIKDEKNVKLDDNLFVNRKFIEIGDLKGCSFKCESPSSNELKNKCIILCGPNGSSAVNLVYKNAIKTLLDKGASVVAVDYRGYGHSKLKVPSLRISQNTLYNDGEKIYEYVSNNLGYKSIDIITFGFSLGGSVASHIADYVYSQGQTLGGIILASPINNLISAGNNATFSPLGWVARGVTLSQLDTNYNLRNVSKNTPIFICSGDNKDWLSFNNTHLNKRIKELGFTNVTEYIAPDCDHNQLNKMFEIEDFKDKNDSNLYKYINSISHFIYPV